MKPCSVCGETKPLTQFYRNETLVDGHVNTCIPCVKARALKHRNANLARARELDRKRNLKPARKAMRDAWKKTPKGRETLRRTVQKWRDKNKVKTKAHRLLWKAIHAGQIFRQPCEKCGTQKVHAHHDDYSKPTKLRWLCPKHHVEHHKFSYRKPLPGAVA